MPLPHQPAPPPAPDSEQARLQAWYAKARGLHRWKRFAGIVGCLIAVLVLVYGKWGANAPEWVRYLGLGIAAASVLLMIYTMVDRMNWVKKNPYKP